MENHSKPPRVGLTRPWPWLIGLTVPLVILGVIGYAAALSGDAENQRVKLMMYSDLLETLSPWLLAVAAGVYWLKAIFTRNVTYVIMLAIVACLLLRELHWAPTIKIAIFPLLGICFFWLLMWRDVVDKPSQNPWQTVFLILALSTYAAGQLIEKRVFKFVPGEDMLHTQLEETVEFCGHVFFLFAAVVGNWRRKALSNPSQ
jgi:hypothetical protein